MDGVAVRRSRRLRLASGLGPRTSGFGAGVALLGLGIGFALGADAGAAATRYQPPPGWRELSELVTAARGLIEEEISAWCYTGGYHFPPATVTGSVRGDLVLVDLILGVGELAISDHRSSQPTLDELLRVAGDAHVGGLMAGKAGVVHLHLGDGDRGLGLVREALDRTEIPPSVFYPTHVNRRRRLFEQPREPLLPIADGLAVDLEDVAEHLPPERVCRSNQHEVRPQLAVCGPG